MTYRQLLEALDHALAIKRDIEEARRGAEARNPKDRARYLQEAGDLEKSLNKEIWEFEG